MMNKLVSGIDLVEIERVESAVARHGVRFLERIYTPAELEICKHRPQSLAARFAAKEAVAKALGTGIGQVAWHEIEILHGPSNEPQLYLHGSAAELADLLGLQTWSISLSHTHEHAIAIAVAIGNA